METTDPRLPVYPYWDQVPANLKTKTQLAKEGLKPKGPVRAQISYFAHREERTYQLYDVGEAIPKKAATPAQLEALERGRAAAEAKREAAWQAACAAEEEEFEEMLAVASDKSITWARRLLKRKDLVILDTETTGLDDAEIVQICVLHPDGTVLLDTYIKPERPIPEDAIRIHGITDAMVADAPAFGDIVDTLAFLLHGKRVAGYNIGFDLGMLDHALYSMFEGKTLPFEPDIVRAAAREAATHWRNQFVARDVMERYAALCGEWSEWHSDFRWQRLPGGDHSAIGDCRACLRVLQEMASTPLSTEADHV